MAKRDSNATMTVGPARSRTELSALLDIIAPTFNFPRELADRYQKLVGARNFRVIRDGPALLGGLALIPMGQFFGGRSVPMTGVAVVGVAPEHRGRGAALTLMRCALQEMQAQGTPLSALYPAVWPLYQAAGYGVAGARYEIKLALRELALRDLDRALVVRRARASDKEPMARLYRSRAASTAGNLDRTELLWRRVRQPRGETAQGFVVANPARRDAIEAYAYYLQKPSTEAPYSLQCSDVVAAAPQAGRRLLAFLGAHCSLADYATYHGHPDDPLLKLLPERSFKAKLVDHWMLRIVDVKRALEARGYSRHITARAEFEVRDEVLPQANNGRFAIAASNGKCHVRTIAKSKGAARPCPVIDVRGLAALYSGHATPRDLMVAGLLEAGARSERDLESLASIFAGANPWMPDMF